MTKKDWIITAAIILAIVTALSIYCVPRRLDRVLGLNDETPTRISGHVSTDTFASIRSYKPVSEQEMTAFMETLQTAQVTYVNGKNVYQVGDVCADVVVHYGEDQRCFFVFFDNGAEHYDDKNYKCKDTAAVKDLLTQIQSWELYHESTP